METEPKPNNQENLKLAWEHHQAGNLSLAEHLYRQILTSEPERADILCLLGILYRQLGQIEEAIAAYRQAISLQPDFVEVHFNLGNAFKEQGDKEAAIACYERAVSLKPDYADAHSNLGLMKQEQGFLEVAITHYQQALAINPNLPEATCNLGNALSQQGKIEEAIAQWERALALKPNFPLALISLGTALQQRGQLTEAIARYQQALQIEPNNAEVRHKLGTSLLDQGNLAYAQNLLAEALSSYQQAIENQPNLPEVYYNLGNLLRNQGKIAEAIASYQQALVLKPDFVDTLNNLGIAWRSQGQFQEAISCYSQAIQFDPNHAIAHFNLGVALLLAGDFQRGFAEYEWRWRRDEVKKLQFRQYPQPLWDGSDLQGRTILLRAEQGFGDTIQFIRYVPIVKRFGGKVIVECFPPLKRLFQQVAGIDWLAVQGEEVPEFHVQAPLLSLPYILGTTLETIPADVPYLTLPSNSKFPLLQNPKLKVGIVWSGSPIHKENNQRSCSFTHFFKLLDIPGITFYSLQKELSENDLALLRQTPIEDLSAHLGDFADTAAIISQLDLVITVDTSVAHLAGAMSRPTWVLLGFIPDWRWMLEREDSPWYPTMRLFRQSQLGDWEGVFERVKVALLSEFASYLTSFLKDHPNGGMSEKISREDQEKARLISPNLVSEENQKSLTSFASDPPMKVEGVGITWPVSLTSGWGIYGMNLALQLLHHSHWKPVLLVPPAVTPGSLNPLHELLLKPVFVQQKTFQILLDERPENEFFCNFPVIYALGNNFKESGIEKRIKSDFKVGAIFFEDTNFTPDALKSAQKYNIILVGSSWNAELLKNVGFNNVYIVYQGIDPALFHPAPKSNLFKNRFVIFSGGKLEYRKGQDIIIAAFKQFRQRHPEALLLTAWHNFWPQYMQGIEQTGHVVGLPKVTQNGRVEISKWLLDNWLPTDSFIDIGMIPNPLVPQVLREADVAVFTNRCEGGTNLAAMESMACGIPTILSANTGHLDLIRDENCYPLKIQKTVQSTPMFMGTEGWGESDVEEVIEALEIVYSDRETAKKRGLAAAVTMQDWTWEKQVSYFLEVLDYNTADSFPLS